jgi:F-type H+-transporting ATPase subunit a
MRQTLLVITIINVGALAIAAVTGNLPPWPDIRQPEITGIPIIEFSGEAISISNSLFTMWLVMGLLIGISWLATRRLSDEPGRLQSLVEELVQGFADFVVGVGGQGALRFLPLFGTLFLFIVVSNWLGVMPFVGQVPWLKAPTSDYHVTAGLALTSFVYYQSVGIRRLKLGYFTRWFNFTGFREGIFLGFVMVIVGLIELISEIFRILSLLLRLWGNIWGGEIALSVITALVVVPIFAAPLIGLELLVGLVQALVFSLLVLVYITLALESHDDGHEDAHDAHPASTGDTSQMAQEVTHA